MARTPQEAERFRERERLILDTTRRIAEDEGWAAVTVRRLADEIGFSQPILYRHFPGGRDEIVERLVVTGYTELATRMASPDDDLRHLITAYLDYARTNPALYEAMASARTSFAFASGDTPEVLVSGFAVVERAAGGRDAHDRTVRAELLWSLLHGVSGLSAGGRLDDALGADRERLIATLFATPVDG
ncbi:TetR/AcrR family transcriptional regulator [Agromyces sp. H3Y2-19a]|uniref:TetR/AcrR family transcriptional regulator n=1 Tax=Agromyces chromiiresistens TaxID=3030835 RepID=UPI0023BA15A4|nr:TetR/AcrR family transcriptional regulator [Agromyces chromiiresistens]MDF0514103.1 TetR/AcrR family transcriptional regulator [Agromyces chromiiresistens]